MKPLLKIVDVRYPDDIDELDDMEVDPLGLELL
jgi:hypothetical protein